MDLTHAQNQSGGYHHFLPAVARQLQRHVRQRWLVADARSTASVSLSDQSHIDPAAGRHTALNQLGAHARRSYLTTLSRSVGRGAQAPAR